MPVTITLSDDLAERIERKSRWHQTPETCNCLFCQIVELIDQARAALATAPIEGSGAHGVDDEPELDEIIDACREARKRVGARCPRCGRHDGHYDSCTYGAPTVNVVPAERPRAIHAPTGGSYGWVK